MKSLKEKLRQNKAITLVSLVVTIVVLLILAGVSIPMFVGEEGIIKQSKKQKANIELKENINNKTISSLESELNEKREDILLDISKGTNYITLSNVHMDEGNANAYYYSIKKSTDSTYKDLGTSNAYESITANNLIHNTDYKVKITAKYNNTVVKEIIKTVHTDELVCASLNMKIEDNGLDYNNNTWVNKNVKVSLTDSTNNSYYTTSDSAQKIDKTQDETVISTSGVTKIKVVATDGTNTIDNDYIIKIDKEVPTPGKLILKKGDVNGENYEPGTWSNQNVYVALDDCKDEFSGIKSAKYSINNRTPLTESFTLKNEEICSIVATVEDYAGNVSTSEAYEVKIDKTNPENIISLVNQTLLPNGTGSTGDYQEYIVQETGDYKISAYGAAGSNGSTSTTKGTSKGGKGALVYGEFELNQGDRLIMLVGQKGLLKGTQTSMYNATSGGGGGGTFVTKVDNTSAYKLTAKNNELVTPLLVAAGGNGGNNVAYQGIIRNGADGIWTNGTSDTGFTRFLTSPDGITYSRGLTAVGGYGGGSGTGDWGGYAGGWQLGGSYNKAAYSYISELAKNSGGETGNNDGNGEISITLDVEDEKLKYFISASDDFSGIDFQKSKYIIDTSSELKGNDQAKWSNGIALTGEKTKGTCTPENEGTYYIHTLVVDNADNAVEMIERAYYDISDPILTITSSGEVDQYPDILTITAEDAGTPIKYIELPDGTKIKGDGVSKKITATFNATRNGPLTFKVVDESGKETIEVYQENNVVNFETEWTITEENTTITVPVTGTVDVYIDYGDGNAENVTTEKPTHTYADAGTYTMKISGSCTSFDCSGNASAYQYITGLKKWGCLSNSSYIFGGNIAYINNSYWYGCKNMTGNIPVPHEKSFQNIRGLSFSHCSGLTGSIPENLFANCPNVTSFYKTFDSCSGLTGSIPENLFANCPLVKNFDFTFYSCSGLTESIPGDLFANCTNVTSFYNTFAYCRSLTGSIPENLFANCPNVTSFYFTFFYCSSLTGSIPENLFASCPNVTNFGETFNSCSSLTGSIPENLFANCLNVMSFDGTFAGCSGLTGSIPENLFINCPNVTSFSSTFHRCSSLTGSISEKLFANCPNVTSFGSTFYGCSGLTKSIPGDLFANCTNVTSFYNTFAYCRSLTGSIPENLFANCPNVTDFSGTFDYCGSLTGSIPENLFANCPNVTDFLYTFSRCSGLTGSIPENIFASCPSVTSFYGTFKSCSGLTGSIPEKLFADCPNVTDFNSTFYMCSGLTGSIPEKLFANCLNVTTFGNNNNYYNSCGTFEGCSGLTGNAPALWTRVPDGETNGYQGTPSGKDCFAGCTNLTNYSSIPEFWK